MPRVSPDQLPKTDAEWREKLTPEQFGHLLWGTPRGVVEGWEKGRYLQNKQADELIRSLAKRLAGNGPDSARIRDTVRRTISGEQSKKGGILSALRRSPLVGAELNFKRPAAPDRKVDL